MSWTDPTFIDLLTVCSDAPWGRHRYAACVLLARELVARLAMDTRDVRPPQLRDTPGRGRVPDHFAYRDLEGAPDGDGLDALLYADPEHPDLTVGGPGLHHGGALRARRYLHYSPSSTPTDVPVARYPQVTVPRVPASGASYTTALAAILPVAVELVALVVDAMGEPAFADAREPFAAALEARFPGVYA